MSLTRVFRRCSLPIPSMSVDVCSRWLKVACIWTTCSDSVYSDRMSETWCWRPSGPYNSTTSHTPLLNSHTAHYHWWRTSILRYPFWQLILSIRPSSFIHHSFIFSKIFIPVMVVVDPEPLPCTHTFSHWGNLKSKFTRTQGEHAQKLTQEVTTAPDQTRIPGAAR